MLNTKTSYIYCLPIITNCWWYNTTWCPKRFEKFALAVINIQSVLVVGNDFEHDQTELYDSPPAILTVLKPYYIQNKNQNSKKTKKKILTFQYWICD
jgi:hypothetical protein